MVLEALLGAGREIVAQSWTVAAVFSKYILLLVGAKLAYENRFELEEFQEELLKHSRPAVYFFFASGIVLAFTGLAVEPLFTLFSQLTALLLLGFLFWSY